jgi:hypothetical protein
MLLRTTRRFAGPPGLANRRQPTGAGIDDVS